jgi:hypothetical protein
LGFVAGDSGPRFAVSAGMRVVPRQESSAVNSRIERRRTWGAAATEYIVVAVLIGISAVAIWSRLGPSAKCRMQVALQKLDSNSSDEPVSCDDTNGDSAANSAPAPAPFTAPSVGDGTSSGGGASDNAANPATPAAGDSESCPGGVCTVPGNCFVAGTQVMTEEGALPIERVTVGMRVLSRDQEGDAIAWKPVVHAFSHQTSELVELTIGQRDAPETIAVTPTHRVYAKGRGWVSVDALTPGSDELVDAEGHDVGVLAAVSLTADVTVYNFEVADFHTYYVGQHSFWAHNTCPHGNDYHCFGCGDSASGNLTRPPPTTYYAPPTYNPPAPNIVYATPSYHPPAANIVHAAPAYASPSYAPAPKPSGGGGNAGGNDYSAGGNGYVKDTSKLTDDEKKALKKYTIGSNYINKPLRNGEMLPKKDWQDVKNVDSALKKLPKTYGTFYRGVSANSRILHKKYITDDGYMSFSDDKKVATEFFDSPLKPMKKGDHPTLFIYDGKLPGIQEFAVEKYQWEKEFLMSRGAKLKVIDAYTTKDGVQILKLGKPDKSEKDKKEKKPIQIGYVKKGGIIKHKGKEWEIKKSGDYYINGKGELVYKG